MPNGTHFELNILVEEIHVDVASITARIVTNEDDYDPEDLAALKEEEARVTPNILAAIRRLAEIVENQGVRLAHIYDGNGHQIGYYCYRAFIH